MKRILKYFKRDTPPDTARTLGRNQSCWCGSGVKYKNCHCAKDQLYFAQLRASGPRGGSGPF